MSSYAPGKHIPYLDGWRGIAIILVLANHFAHLDGAGLFGVTLFFVLSGMLMSRILFVNDIPLGLFYRRRIARVFPVFYFYITVIALLAWWYGTPMAKQEFLATALFLRTYYMGRMAWTDNVPMGHLWSLGVEEHCYIILSLVALGARRFKGEFALLATSLLCVVCLGFFCYYQVGGYAEANAIHFLRTECYGFALFISCGVFLWLRHLKLRIPVWLPVASGLLGSGIALLFPFGIMTFAVSPLLLAVCLNTLDAVPAWLLKALGHPVFAWFGLCSYSLYIWQQPFVFLHNADSVRYPSAVCFALAVIVGVVSYYCIERPMRKWLRGNGNKDKAEIL